MKISKELILKIELTGEDLELFKLALEKVIQSEKTNNLGIGILSGEQKTLIETILSTIKTWYNGHLRETYSCLHNSNCTIRITQFRLLDL